jgi:hypothetical protein
VLAPCHRAGMAWHWKWHAMGVEDAGRLQLAFGLVLGGLGMVHLLLDMSLGLVAVASKLARMALCL